MPREGIWMGMSQQPFHAVIRRELLVDAAAVELNPPAVDVLGIRD